MPPTWLALDLTDGDSPGSLGWYDFTIHNRTSGTRNSHIYSRQLVRSKILTLSNIPLALWSLMAAVCA